MTYVDRPTQVSPLIVETPEEESIYRRGEGIHFLSPWSDVWGEMILTRLNQPTRPPKKPSQRPP